MTSYYERVIKGKLVTQIEPMPVSFLPALFAIPPETGLLEGQVRFIMWRMTPEALHFFQHDRPSFIEILDYLVTYYGFPPGGMVFFANNCFSWSLAISKTAHLAEAKV
jgi:hypothetical protein